MPTEIPAPGEHWPPFDSDLAREAGRRSGISRRRKIEEEKRQAAALGHLRPLLEGMGIGELATMSLKRVLTDLATGDIKINPVTLPALVKALHEVTLLDADRPTAITMTGDRTQLLAAAKDLMAEIQARRELPLPIEVEAGYPIDVEVVHEPSNSASSQSETAKA